MACAALAALSIAVSFRNLLVSMLEANNIDYVRVEEADYDSRFLQCVGTVKRLMGA